MPGGRVVDGDKWTYALFIPCNGSACNHPVGLPGGYVTVTVHRMTPEPTLWTISWFGFTADPPNTLEVCTSSWGWKEALQSPTMLQSFGGVARMNRGSG